MDTRIPLSVGLEGDGDELLAIGDVERAFGVKLEYGTAGQWLTAGDVYEALLAAMPAAEREDPDLWARFAEQLCGTTDVDPRHIQPGSPLLSESRFWGKVADASAVIWIAAAIAFAGLIGVAFLTR